MLSVRVLVDKKDVIAMNKHGNSHRFRFKDASLMIIIFMLIAKF